jgi:3-phytase
MSRSRTLSRRRGLGLALVLLVAGPAAAVAAVPDPTRPRPPTVPIDEVAAVLETEPVAGEKDAADDPAIWINPWDRSLSLVIGTDKRAKNLEVYDLAGRRLQQIHDANESINNVDVRYGFPLGGEYVDIVVTGGGDITIYKVDPFTRQLVDVSARTIKATHGAWGICLYRSPHSGLYYAFAQAVHNGFVEQFELFDNGLGQVDARPVRGPWDVNPADPKVEDGEIEACTVDDRTGDYYVAEQDVGVWRYGAEPTAPTELRTLVLSTYLVNNGPLVPDVEGIAVIHDDFGSFLLVSSQGDSSFGVFGVDPLVVPYPLLRKFRVGAGPAADGCSITDGLDATSLWLGPEYPHGLFVCQDDRNTAPGVTGTQNFKFVPLETVIPGINPYSM